ncbi:MAG: hypothetical protein R3E42_05805 [Burkholderiaceae bacterium]
MTQTTTHQPPSPKPTPPRSAPHRRALAWVALGGLVGGLVLGELSGWPFLRAPLEQAINRASGVAVKLEGSFHTRLLLHPRLTVEHIAVAPGGGVDVPHLLKAQGFDVQWRWRDLWRAWRGESLRVKSLEAETLDAHLVRLSDQSVSWDVMPRRTAEDSSAASTPLPTFERLALEAGHIEWRDEPGKTKIEVKIHIDPAATDRLPWQATASGHYQGHALRAQIDTTPDMPLLLEGPASRAMVPLKASGSIGNTRWSFDGRAGAVWAGQDLKGACSWRALAAGQRQAAGRGAARNTALPAGCRAGAHRRRMAADNPARHHRQQCAHRRSAL